MTYRPAWRPAHIETRTLGDLDRAVRSFLPNLGEKFKLVVGVPRSGMLPASLIASYLDLPLVDLDGYLSGGSGATGNRGNIAPTRREGGVLVVDDSVATGWEMNRVKSRIQKVGLDGNCRYLAVFGIANTVSVCDYICEITTTPRIFSWNAANSWVVSHACVDIDGLLCPDPNLHENDDGEEYRRFLDNAPTLYKCCHKIKHIVTARLEKYREDTKVWLERCGIEFEHLHMVDLPDKASRLQEGPGFHARYKAQIFQQLHDAIIFIESSDRQARDIAEISGKVAFSAESGVFFRPSAKSIRRCQMRYYAKHPRAALGLLRRRLIG